MGRVTMIPSRTLVRRVREKKSGEETMILCQRRLLVSILAPTHQEPGAKILGQEEDGGPQAPAFLSIFLPHALFPGERTPCLFRCRRKGAPSSYLSLDQQAGDRRQESATLRHRPRISWQPVSSGLRPQALGQLWGLEKYVRGPTGLKTPDRDFKTSQSL